MHNQPYVLKLEVSSALCVSSSLGRQLTDQGQKMSAPQDTYSHRYSMVSAVVVQVACCCPSKAARGGSCWRQTGELALHLGPEPCRETLLAHHR